MKVFSKGALTAAAVVAVAVVGYTVKTGYIFIDGVSEPPLVGRYRVDTGQSFELKNDGSWTLSLSDGFRSGTWVQIDESHIALKNQGSTGTGTRCTFTFAGYSVLRLSGCSLEAVFTRA